MKRLLIALLPLLAAGCGGTQTGEVVDNVAPVSGTATYEGKPLEDYTVYFGNLQVRPAAGKIDAQGHFTLGTNGPDDGAPPGNHRVWFNYSPVIEQEPGKEQIDAPVPPPKVKIPKKYTDMNTTDLKIEVPPEGLQDYKIELK
jgi:hypothetical protein